MKTIAGGGLTGLSCALELLIEGYDVQIFEARQEIGNPVRSPGWFDMKFDNDILESSLARKTPHGYALRREWLERRIAAKVLDQGGIIHLKHRISNKIDAIDCLGGKTISPGWPGESNILSSNEELVKWVGGLVIKEDLPKEFEIDTIQENKLCLLRGDGLVECWERESFSHNPSRGWLELMNGEHPHQISGLKGDHAIIKGKKLAHEVIK